MKSVFIENAFANAFELLNVNLAAVSERFGDRVNPFRPESY